MTMLAPICLFTYNRLLETQQTIEALKNNFLASKSELFIFSDGAKDDTSKPKVDEVRKYVQTVSGFKRVSLIKADQNKGLASSIISGVSEIIEKYGKVIVVEDDLITTRNFLDFMNQALTYYRNERSIQSVSGFSLDLEMVDLESDVYFQMRPFSWGWATWSDRWDHAIFDKQRLRIEIKRNGSILKKFKDSCGADMAKMFLNSINDQNDSWYVRWAYDHLKNNTFSVYPSISFVSNIGFGESGTHCRGINSFSYKISKDDRRDFNFVRFSFPPKVETRKFLNYFSIRHKVSVRLKLLGTSSGREQLLSEIKLKLNKL